jgi:indolepyruvate ferredoxin oxidoreductase
LAYQQGLIPVSLENLEWAIGQTVKVDLKKNMRAFNLGRKLAAHPEEFIDNSEPKTIARIVREKMNILKKTRLGGEARARAYKYLLHSNLRACRELDKQTMCEIALRVYDLINYEDIAYAQKYLDTLKTIYRRDCADYGFAVTRSAVWNLYKLMLIKDEFWVSHVLTSYEKQRRDHHRYNVNPANGDRIVYKRVFHPRFFGVMVSLPMPHWMMYVMKQMKFVRRYLPLFHREDREFLRWYRRLLEGMSYRNEREYQQFLSAIACVDQVKGYREYRTPTMEKARREAEAILSKLPLNPSDQNGRKNFQSSDFTNPDRDLAGAREIHIINKVMNMFKQR